MPTKDQQDKKAKQDRKEFTPEEKLDYYRQRIAYWQTKLPKLLAPRKIKHAKARIAYYEGKEKTQAELIGSKA